VDLWNALLLLTPEAVRPSLKIVPPTSDHSLSQPQATGARASWFRESRVAGLADREHAKAQGLGLGPGEDVAAVEHEGGLVHRRMHRREPTARAWAPAADSGVSLVSFLRANPSTAIRLPETVLTSVATIWRAKRAFRQVFILTTPSQGQEGVSHELQQLRQKKGTVPWRAKRVCPTLDARMYGPTHFLEAEGNAA
jgi:hypothetical protein